MNFISKKLDNIVNDDEFYYQFAFIKYYYDYLNSKYFILCVTIKYAGKDYYANDILKFPIKILIGILLIINLILLILFHQKLEIISISV